MIVPKGEWQCEQGSRWDKLQRSELIESYRKWESRCHAIGVFIEFYIDKGNKIKKLLFNKVQSVLVEGSILIV
jgi:hypothetical protein